MAKGGTDKRRLAVTIFMVSFITSQTAHNNVESLHMWLECYVSGIEYTLTPASLKGTQVHCQFQFPLIHIIIVYLHK